ncbi:uncharacterized protein [Mytilus edulis]|uniref:uncharacterized protein n=1 Tax=Mytilus edulis TaxID=6550 RepID=UPI0039EEE928
MCPKGTYQDESGQVNCKSCPNGLTTYFIASKNGSECTVYDIVTDTLVTESSGNQYVAGVVVGIVIPLIMIVFIVYFGWKKYRTYIYEVRRKEKLKKLSEMKEKQDEASWSNLFYQPDNF